MLNINSNKISMRLCVVIQIFLPSCTNELHHFDLYLVGEFPKYLVCISWMKCQYFQIFTLFTSLKPTRIHKMDYGMQIGISFCPCWINMKMDANEFSIENQLVKGYTLIFYQNEIFWIYSYLKIQFYGHNDFLKRYPVVKLWIIFKYLTHLMHTHL